MFSKQFEMKFSDEAYSALDRLAELSGVQNKGEVIKDALRLYEWYLSAKSDGNKVFVGVEKNCAQEVELLF